MGGKKERRLFQSCFDLMTTLIQLFLQTINRTEECRSEIFALNGETSLNKKLASSLHRRQMNAFFFLPFPTKTKQCFYVLCKWFRHVVWQFYFCYFFFQLKEKPRGKMLGWHFIWMNIWIQNLPGGVARFFFFQQKNWWCQEGASCDENQLSSSKIKLLFFSHFLFLLVLI